MLVGRRSSGRVWVFWVPVPQSLPRIPRDCDHSFHRRVIKKVPVIRQPSGRHVSSRLALVSPKGSRVSFEVSRSWAETVPGVTNHLKRIYKTLRARDEWCFSFSASCTTESCLTGSLRMQRRCQTFASGFSFLGGC